MDQRKEYPPLRAPKTFNLSADAAIFIPKSIIPKEEQSTSHLHQQYALAQGGVEPGGGDGGGGGSSGYDYASQLAHGGGAGPMANGVDVMKMSTVQSRISNMQICDGDTGKEFNHHQHHQQPMHHYHHQQQQHRGQHHAGGHHGGYQQQQQQHHHHQQQHQAYQYGGVGGYGSNHHHMNHQVQHHHGGGMPGEHRKYNNGGGQHHRGGRGQHHHYQHQHHQHQHHHQHQQQHQHQQHQYGGPHHHDPMGGGGGGYNAMGSNWGPMGGQDGFDQLGDRKSEALDYLTAVIAELYDNPGMFDEVKEKLPKELGDMAQDQDVLSSAIEMIFNQSIQESNFRYMGARLCQLLDSLDQRPESLVRRLLELKMDDLERVALPEYMKQEQVKVRGATLFLAELYMQLRNPGQALGKTISEHIISAIQILLIKHGSENIKCVCQSLKLCGFELEQDCPDKVEAILKNLEQLKVQSSAEAMIHSVLDLRKISWGRSEEIATSAAPPPPMQGGSTGMHHMPAGIDMGPGFHDSPVFYGPDGQVLTEEESSFLETNGFVLPTKGRFDDSDDELGLDEQDLEIQEAYADFLESNRSNQQQQQQHQQQQPGV